MIYIYGLLLFFVTIYSFSLIDPNLTFFQSKWWSLFRDKMVEFGYYHRDVSWIVYFAIVIALFISHFLLVKKFRQIKIMLLSLVIGMVLLFSYPFLSHDFFNYMFDAKIVTYYHQNPYAHRAADFPSDQWLRFMHWTHRTYPYGPIFLLITLPASFLSFGKFTLNFIFFKATFLLFYLLTVYSLNKLSKRWAVIFATHPLVLIEGIINNHNDLFAVSLASVGFYFLACKKINIRARIFFLLSAGIKYTTTALVFFSKNNKTINLLIFLLTLTVISYLSFTLAPQPWYFLTLFAFLPFFEDLINRLNIFFFGLLVSYYPYIRLGGWDTAYKVAVKNWLIAFFLIINFIYLSIFYALKLQKKFK